MRYTCTVCTRELVTRKDELTWSELASGAVPVPYHVCIREEGAETAYACADCISQYDGPGKFEGLRYDRATLGKALILYSWSQDSGEDYYMYSEGWGYCGKFGRFLLTIDDRGFVGMEEYDDATKCQKAFDAYYNEGWGADEYDGYVFEDRRGYGAQFEGKPLDVWPPRHSDYVSQRRALARVRLEMMRTGFYPAVWIVNERGSLTLAKGV